MSDGTVAGGVSAGALLRQAREAAGLHVDTLAANLKVPVRKLEALEEDRYDLLGDAVFIRALASSVARTLKIDPQPVLGRLPQTSQPRLVPDTEGINAPFRAPGDGPSPGVMHHVSKPVVLIVAALLIGALVIMFLPYVQQGYETVTQANRGEPAAAPAAAVPAPGETQVAAFPAATPAAEPLPAPANGTVAATKAAPTLAIPAAPAALPAPAMAAAAAPNPAASASQPVTGPETAAAAVPATAVVVFRTRGPSWIQVTDARGTTVLRRLMAAGDSAGAGGTLPLSVTVGDAGQTDVQVRGKPFSLAPLTRDNVARFEVK
ncbi:MAG TPA: RodZ domain-containing protein [Ramlibacter sp.]|nr:RodZ domain-containing protein [Ramlibacter sp.]